MFTKKFSWSLATFFTILHFCSNLFWKLSWGLSQFRFVCCQNLKGFRIVALHSFTTKTHINNPFVYINLLLVDCCIFFVSSFLIYYFDSFDCFSSPISFSWFNKMSGFCSLNYFFILLIITIKENSAVFLRIYYYNSKACLTATTSPTNLICAHWMSTEKPVIQLGNSKTNKNASKNEDISLNIFSSYKKTINEQMKIEYSKKYL